MTSKPLPWNFSSTISPPLILSYFLSAIYFCFHALGIYPTPPHYFLLPKSRKEHTYNKLILLSLRCGYAHPASWAAAPKKSMTYAFTLMGKFLLLHPWPGGQNPNLKAKILTWRPKSYLKAKIPSSNLQSQNPSLEGFGSQDWDLGLKARICASRLRYEPAVGGGGWRRRRKKFPKCVKA